MSRISRFTAKTIIAALCVAVFVSSGVIIHADNDDEYIQFNDYETAQAYRFWSLYGLTPDTSSTYTQTYTTTGTTTQSAQISLAGSGVEGGTFSLQDITAKTIEWWKADQYIASQQLQNFIDNLEIKIAGDPQDKRDQMSLHFGGCQLTATNLVDGEPRGWTMSCDGSTDNYYYNNTTYEVEFNSNIANIGSNGNGGVSGDAGIYIKNAYGFTSTDSGQLPTYANYRTEYDGLGSISLQETFNESGTISSTGTITTTTTTTNTNSLKYVYPFVRGTINNAFGSNATTTKRFYNQPDNPFTVIVLSTSGTYLYGDHVYQYYNNEWNDEGNLSHANRYYIGGWFVQTFQFYDQNVGKRAMYIDWRNLSTFIPVYAGYKNSMSNELYRWVYGSDRLIEAIYSNGSQTRDLIDNGTPESQAVNTELLGQAGEFGEASDALFTFEDSQIDDMNDALNNARTPSNKDLLRSTKFIASANWVTTQFMRLVTDTPLELVLYFCLTMGLAIVFIKKVE